MLVSSRDFERGKFAGKWTRYSTQQTAAALQQSKLELPVADLIGQLGGL
jgi:hypothetical protein